MTKQKQKIMAIAIIGGLLCIVSLLALHVGTIMIPIGGGIQSILNGDRKSTRLNSSHSDRSRMPSSA